MQFYSTNKKSNSVSFKEATLLGQPSDKGLFFPEQISRFSEDFLANFKHLSKAETAFEMIKDYVGDEIPRERLFKICEETVDFNFPLVKVTDSISALELFHGETLAFKDVGARFMSRCLGHFAQNIKQKIVVIVATSGDTGGAVANGFYDIEGVEVVILYPSGKVSRVQELQLTTLGKNITALEVDGNFDDCQTLAKQALADDSIKEKVFLTSANSINVARWLPQQFYYAFALQKWNEEIPPTISVPSGNFGNICAGLMAKTSGLPLGSFIAACNANDVVTRYLSSENYDIQPAIATLSNAMDVGNPSNFVRILEIFKHNFEALKDKISSLSVSDETTSETIREVFYNQNYLLDPHGAVAFYALRKLLQTDEKGLFLATAHPIKFDSVEEILGKKTEIPKSIESLFDKEKVSIKIDVSYEKVKEIILTA
jgi:threonine synthase